MSLSRILLIEDDPDIRDSVEDVLGLEGYNLQTAPNGLAGIHLAQTQQPDLIICDVNMPELDGYGVLSALRSDPTTCGIPFIFLTGRGEREDMRQGMALGADDYLTKPFGPEELTHAIASRLERRTQSLTPLKEEQKRSEMLQRQVKVNQEVIDLKARLLDKLLEELRTPLANINMALSMLERSRTEEERTRYLSILRQEYSREVALITEVSNFQEFTRANGSVGVSPMGFLSRMLS
jgi:two-component system, OmpR family, alkaline phosphatase synthesis response regulator PhoP